MKWNKEKKELVYQLLKEKAQPWDAEDEELIWQQLMDQKWLYDPSAYYKLPGLMSWNQFLDSLGIDRVERGFETFVDHDGRSCLKRSRLLGIWRLSPPYHNPVYPERGREIKWSRDIIYPEKGYGEPAQSNKHIIIADPFLDSYTDKGLRIPKEVANKFLVLGVP